MGDLSKINKQPVEKKSYENFMTGKVDVIPVYLTSQPYQLEKQGIEFNIIKPQTYGIDYYGDNFFTSQVELDKYPDRVEKMSRATIQGWRYALDHPDEIIALIRSKYAPTLSEEYLQFQARTMRQFILPEFIELGSFDPKRYQQIAKEYQQLGLTQNDQIKDQFFYNPSIQEAISSLLSVDEKKWLRENPKVKVAVESDWAPFDFLDKDGKFNGVANDYLNLITKKTGLKFESIVGEWNDNVQKIKDKRVDLLSAAYFFGERTEYMNFSTPYFEVLDYFFIRDDLNISTIKELDGKRVAIPKGYVHEGVIKKHFPKINIVTVANIDEAIDAVVEHRADMLYDAYAVLTHKLKKQAISSIIPFKSAREYGIGNKTIHFTSRIDEPYLSSIIQKGLDEITSKEKQEIYNKWVGAKAIVGEKINLTEAEEAWLKAHQIIRFTGDPNWLPYEAFDKQGNYKGIVAEHLKLIEQKLGIKVDVIPTKTWTESVAKVKRGEIDVLSETSNSALKSHLTFTQPYLASPIVIVMNKNEGYVENINQIKDKKIAVIKEYGYVPEIIAQYSDVSFEYVKTIQEGLTAVSTGKTDALLATLAQASYHISELGVNNIRIIGQTEFSTKLAFGMREEFAPLVLMFNRALSSINQAEKQHILNKWGKAKYVEKIDYDLLAKIAVLFFTIVAVFIYWNRKLADEIQTRKELEAQTQALIDNVPLQIIVTSMDGSILTANPKALNEYHIHKDEISQFNILEFYHDVKDRESMVKELTEKGKVEQRIIPFKQPNGTLRSMMISVMPVNFHHKKAFLTIAVDMTERLEIEVALQEAKDHAEKASRAKTEFLSNMSHEIRTPMNAIIGFTELLSEQVKEPRLKSFVKTIQSAGNNLLTLINDVLDLSKIEAGKLKIEKTACNPHDFFSEIGNIFMLKMQEKNIDFIIDIDPVIPQSLQMDDTRLRQVLFNLIGNAVKFTNHGYIRLSVTTDNEDKIASKLDLVINVKDTGIGISEDQQKIVFQQFEQSSGQDNKIYGGSGLGLSISYRLVEMMGGEILLESQIDKGSTFTVKLKDVHVASLTVDAPKATLRQKEDEKIIKLHASRVLIVDDVIDNIDLLLANFEETDLTIATAMNGLEAVNLVKQQIAIKQPFDLVLMDIRMPVMDGYQAAREIKTINEVPVIALTASVMTDEFERIKNNNFKGYLRKPVLKAALFAELCKFLPFEKVDRIKDEKVVALTAVEITVLPVAIERLKGLTEQCEHVLMSNNLIEIKAFADAVMEITEDAPITMISDYTEQFMEEIDSFDIGAIKKSLNDYPQLISQLIELEEAKF
jgi:two-component system sensor histidine kinase EvgS